MRRKLLQFSSIIAGLSFLGVFFGMAILNMPGTKAVTAMDFNAGNIIDDEIFYNKDTMTVADIQAHLNKYMPACDTWGTGAVGSGRYINGVAVPPNTTRAEYARQMKAAGKTRYHEPPYVCVQNFYENPETHETLYETNNKIKDGMISAAQIIYDAAQKYNINPQVLLVLLKKESYVWGDNWPLKDEYNTVMGYACPDNAPCNEKYFGFYNQVMTSAWQLNYYKEHIYSYNYRPYTTNSILYSPTTSCGRKSVYLENIATTSLYIYTPYTPNDAALKNYPGTATCGSYGNRNFFMYFSEWFGSTHVASAVERKIIESYETLSTKDLLGSPVGATVITKTAAWQAYQNGFIVGSAATGYYESRGKIREAWGNTGYQSGALGLPIGNIVNGANGVSWQAYQNGFIVGSDKTGYFESRGKIREYWGSTGYQNGIMGLPTSDITSDENGSVFQNYMTGTLYYYLESNQYIWKKK